MFDPVFNATHSSNQHTLLVGNLYFANVAEEDELSSMGEYACLVKNDVVHGLMEGDKQKIMLDAAGMSTELTMNLQFLKIKMASSLQLIFLPYGAFGLKLVFHMFS